MNLISFFKFFILSQKENIWVKIISDNFGPIVWAQPFFCARTMILLPSFLWMGSVFELNYIETTPIWIFFFKVETQISIKFYIF